MPKVDKAAINTAGIVRGGGVIVSMLGTKTPTASLPKGTIFNNMTRSVMVTLETIRELDLSCSPMLLAKYCTAF